jgi:hypothetical protein
MQLWLDLRPLLGGVVVPTEINFLGILNVNAKKKLGSVENIPQLPTQKNVIM